MTDRIVSSGRYKYADCAEKKKKRLSGVLLVVNNRFPDVAVGLLLSITISFSYLKDYQDEVYNAVFFDLNMAVSLFLKSSIF